MPSGAPGHRRFSRWRAELTPAITLLLFGIALVALDRVLRDYPAHLVLGAMGAVPAMEVVLSTALTALGYLALIGYDYVAFHALGHPMALRRMLLPSFVTYGVGNLAPASLVAGGGLRYRLYRGVGLSQAGAAAVALFNVTTYALGLSALAGLALVLRPAGPAAGPTGIPMPERLAGALLLAGAAAYFLATRFVRRPIQVRTWALRLPSFRTATAQLGVSLADWLLSSGALYVLLLAVPGVSYLSFLSVFLLAQAAAMLLPVPGGVGVFEAVVMLLRPTGAPAAAVLGALLLYRVIYYLLPLGAAGALLAVREVRHALAAEDPIGALLQRFSTLAPHLLAFTTFLAGSLLLVTGALPTGERRLAWMANLLPLAVIEASHFLASLIGAVLIVLAWGLERRANLAYRVVRVLFGTGIVLALLRSFQLPLALFLAICLGILLIAGREFRGPVSLLREPMGAGWGFAVGAAFLVNLWIGVLVLRRAEFAGSTWWRFALFGHAPRALRAAAGASVVMLLFALARLLSRSALRASR